DRVHWDTNDAGLDLNGDPEGCQHRWRMIAAGWKESQRIGQVAVVTAVAQIGLGDRALDRMRHRPQIDRLPSTLRLVTECTLGGFCSCLCQSLLIGFCAVAIAGVTFLTTVGAVKSGKAFIDAPDAENPFATIG